MKLTEDLISNFIQDEETQDKILTALSSNNFDNKVLPILLQKIFQPPALFLLSRLSEKKAQALKDSTLKRQYLKFADTADHLRHCIKEEIDNFSGVNK